MNSIKRRLLLWQTGAILVAAVLVSFITYQLAWDGFNRLRDNALEQIATSILQYGVEPIGSPNDVRFVSQIWDPAGRLKFSSRPEVGLPELAPGMHRLQWQGEEWHIYTLASAEATVQVASTAANRNLMFGAISHWLLLPIAVLVAVLGAMLWLAAGNSLKSLDTMRREISSRDVDQLHKMPAGKYPAEIAPLVEALNSLLDRLEGVLVAQRSFVADAAHELRTPLTAIKLQAQILRSGLADPEQQQSLGVLSSSVDRATHLVEQLLQLARLDPEAAGRTQLRPVRLDELARGLVVEFSGLAEKRRIDLGLTQGEAATIEGDAESLRIMLGNLIDNALRYCGPGNRVDVAVAAAAGAATVSVIDDGPGIPRAEWSAVFERFHRVAGADNPGSGLGLAIVKEIVRLHRGRIALDDSPGGGLTVRVSLPSGASSSAQ